MKPTEHRPSVPDPKAALRRSIGARVREADASLRARWDTAIASVLTGLEQFRQAAVIVGYLALADEVNIDAVLAAAVESGKRVFVPEVRCGGMRFAHWSPCMPLRRCRYGVLEVAGGSVELANVGACLMLLPGRAYDAGGARLGRGRGHYDRVLAGSAGSVCTTGIAYQLQVVGAVPFATHDRRVEMLVTELGCRPCAP